MAPPNEGSALVDRDASDEEQVSRQDQSEDNMRTAAHALAALGLAVFPVREDCRRPFTKHGCYDATTASEGVDALWRRYPYANVSVACGAASKCLVLDVDVKGADGLQTLAGLEAAHGALPQTWRARTPSGGQHIWFRKPTQALRNRVGFMPGLDVRTDGGSVAVPPSRRADGDYTWGASPWSVKLAAAPGWLLELITPPRTVSSRGESTPIGPGNLQARYAAAAVNGECQAVAVCAPGSRNARLFKASARAGELVREGLAPQSVVETALFSAAHQCGLVHDDGPNAVLATIASGICRGMNPRGRLE